MAKLRQFVSDNQTRMIWALVAVSVFVLLALFAISVRRYGWGWTGFSYYTTPINEAGDLHPGKTLWDVLDLVIVPAVLAVLAAVLRRSESKKAVMREELDREIEFDRQREAALQAYLDQMKDLLLEKNLLKSEPEDEVRALARTLTMTTMRRLDGGRNETLLNFLLEARVIRPRGSDRDPLMSFQGANLSRVDLGESVLPKIDLSGANLEGANLERANLGGANLREARLKGASLSDADLDDVFLFEADLEGASLEGARLRVADLGGASLKTAILERANLHGAILSWASLEMANLGEACLRGAYLRGANLNGANLRGADLEGASLDGASSDRKTKWPEGFGPEATETTRQPEIPAGVVEISAGQDASRRGSGFVVTECGYVIAHFNISKEGQQVTVDSAGDFFQLPAKVVARSRDAVLALLKLPDSEGPYPALELATAFDLGDHVYKASLVSGTAEGIISGMAGFARFEADDRSVTVRDIITVANTFHQAGYGGSPLLNTQTKVVGAVIAAGFEPDRYFAVESQRILSEFPQLEVAVLH